MIAEGIANEKGEELLTNGPHGSQTLFVASRECFFLSFLSLLAFRHAHIFLLFYISVYLAVLLCRSSVGREPWAVFARRRSKYRLVGRLSRSCPMLF